MQKIFVYSYLLLACFFSFHFSVPLSGEEAVDQKKVTVPATPELLVMARQLSLKASKIQTEMETFFDTSELEKLLEGVNQHLQEIELHLDQSVEGQRGTYEKLFVVRADLKNLRVLIDRQVDPLYEALEDLHKKSLYWKEEKKKWEEWYSVLIQQNAASSLQEEMRSTNQTIDQTVDRITKESNDLIENILRANASQNEILQIQSRIEHKIENKDRMLISGKSFPLLSSEFLNQFKADINQQLDSGRSVVDLQKKQYSTKSAHFIFLQFFIVLMIAGLLIYIRKNDPQAEQQLSFVLRPFAAGVMICFVLLKTIEPVHSPTWILAERLLLWIAFLRVFSLYFKNRTVLTFFYVLAFTHVLLLLFEVYNFPITFTRLLMFFGSITACAALAVAGHSLHKDHYKIPAFLLVGVGAVFAAVAVMQLFGFASPAQRVFWFTVGTLGVIAIALLSYLMAKELSSWLMRGVVSKRKHVSEANHQVVMQLLHLALLLFFVFCVVIYLLVAWGVYDRAGLAFNAVFTSSLQFGNLKLSLSDVFTAFALAVGTLLVSGLIQSGLVKSVFPSMKIPKEVGFSIARLVHYVLLTVGGLLILLSLGVSLTNLAIFGGAIGVGLGLGLQEIVKNFAAGIIILIERPIKIGDLIEFDTRPCRVEKIGLRSTLVRSVEGILKVIPNNDLIVNPVTNWTHSRKQLRLSSKIGVAYGSDVEQTMQLLKEAAEEHPSVLKAPEAMVLFREFGDSALNFELRYWIEDAAFRVIVPSEVNQSIEKKLSQAGIQIPFPQMDVHMVQDVSSN